MQKTGEVSVDMGPFWIANLAVISVFLLIFAIITFSYLRSYFRMRAKVFSRIAAFGSILVLQSILGIVVYYHLSLRYGSGLAILLLSVNTVTLFGYIILYRILETYGS